MKVIIIIIIIIVVAYLYNEEMKQKKTTHTTYTPQVIGEVQQRPEQSIQEIVMKEFKALPYPKISWPAQESASKPGIFSNLIHNLPSIKIIRDTPENMTEKRQYVPDYYRKDTLSGNTIGTTELNSFTPDLSKADNSWSDDNVSSLPGYHTNDLQNSLTNPGAFFDKQNQYHDLTSPQSKGLVSDTCYTDKQGSKFCLDNTRLQNIPPSLIQDPQHCDVLNSIGSHKEDYKYSNQYTTKNVDIINGQSYVSWDYKNDNVMNGSTFFNSIKASQDKNEHYSPLLDKYATN